MKRPHILILMPDQQRGDALSCAGHPVLQTPNMDRLAAEGMRFSRAYTVSPICMPARASFISGNYPHNHHIWTNSGQLPANDESLFHHLQAAGYYTAHVGKSHYHPQRGPHLKSEEPYMHARGFDYVHETTGPWATLNCDSYMTDCWRQLGLLDAFREDYRRRRQTGALAVWPSPLQKEEFLDSYIGRQAVQFVENYNENKPVCLFVGFGGPHEPWDAPEPYASNYDPKLTPSAIPPEAEPGSWLPKYAAQRMLKGRIENMNPEDVQKLRANYYGKISLVDHWFGEVLKAFDRKGWLENSLVVFWSDHGEMAGDHQRLHKSVFYESSVHVPLIVRWPNRIPAGSTSEAMVEHIDIFPTILEAAGAEPSKQTFGKSLWPAIENPEIPHRNTVFSQIFYDGSPTIMVRTQEYKYAMDLSGEGYLLYDLRSDPNEGKNLLSRPDMRNVEAQMRDLILRFLIRTQARM